MYLPPNIILCIQALERSGHTAYAVGGCVRDHLLGLTPHDYDLCTNAKPNQIKEIFSQYPLVLAGEKHGTVGVVTPGGVVEITTFRTEGAYLDNRHPDSVDFVDRVEEDLSRRDFTVNAMAYSPKEGLIDPFCGQDDLKNHILRAVGDPATRFREDALRILRGVRFAVRFQLTPDPETKVAMVNLAPLMENLARERVFDELCKLLPLVTARDLLAFAPVITQVIPELQPCIGFDQHNPHHIYDVFTHTAHVTEATPACLPLRWAALLHDISKPATFHLDEKGCGHFYGHAKESAKMADSILLRLKAPTALRQQVVLLTEQHMTLIPPEKKAVRRWLSRLGEENFTALLALQEADMGSKSTEVPAEISQFAKLRQLMEQIRAENACLSVKDLAVNGHDLMDLGLSGRQIGQTLQHLLEMVMDERLPNEPSALLTAAKDMEF